MINTLLLLLSDPDPRVRLGASREFLNRGYGPAQPTTEEPETDTQTPGAIDDEMFDALQADPDGRRLLDQLAVVQERLARNAGKPR